VHEILGYLDLEGRPMTVVSGLRRYPECASNWRAALAADPRSAARRPAGGLNHEEVHVGD